VQAEALGIVDAEGPQAAEHRTVLDRLGDSRKAHHVPDLVDGVDHGVVDRIDIDVLYEIAGDLRVIDRQVLEVAERRQTGAEIIERESATHGFETVNEIDGARQVGHRGGLGDFETQAGGR